MSLLVVRRSIGASTLLFLAFGATFLAYGVNAQSEGPVFNQYTIQPDVWHPANPAEPGVDARGDLNLSIPVMTVPGRGGLDYEISFSYQSGIRFDQRGSWIGTGWSFDPGSITRDVFGVIDNGEEHNVDFTGTPSVQPDQYFVSLPVGSSTMTKFVNIGSTAIPPIRVNPSNFYLANWKGWLVETETSANSDPNNPVIVNEFQTQVAQPGQGTQTRADYTKFIITAEDGTRYVFSQPSLSTYLGMSIGLNGFSNERYVSIWRLCAILGPDYQGPEIPTGTEEGSWVLLKYSDVETEVNEEATFLPYPIVQTSYLTEILTPTHKAIFGTGPRNHENFGVWEHWIYNKLATVTLYDRSQLTTIVRKVELVQADEFEHNLQSQSGGTPRLALKQIKFFGRNNISEPGYRFTYNGRVGSGGIGVNNMDLFGFYDTQGGDNGNYNLNTSDGSSWSLDEITYPTGGWDEIAYENDAVVSGDKAYYKAYFYPSNGTSSPAYTFDSSSNRQGGARVTSITRHDGAGSGAGHEWVTDYTYGNGYSTAVPPRWWRFQFEGRPFYSPNERGRASVYYSWIERQNPDGSRVRTHYSFADATGDDASTGSHPGIVIPVQTLVWQTAEFPVAMTLIQGNQDINWGKPYKIEHFDQAGRLVREVELTLDLSTYKLASAWSSIPSEINVVWLTPGNLETEVVTDYGQAGSQSATTTTDYTYFRTPAGGSNTTTTGNGLVRSAEVTHNDGRKRRTTYTYGPEKYQQLVDSNQLSAVVQNVTDERSASGTRSYLSSSVTTWKTFQAEGGSGCPVCRGGTVDLFKPFQRIAWDQATPSSTSPIFTGWGSQSQFARTNWEIKESTEVYDRDGLATEIEDGLGHTTTLEYDGHGRLVAVEKASGQGGALLSHEFGYDENGEGLNLLTSTTDENGNTSRYAYDDLGRLLRVFQSDNGESLTYNYHLPRNGLGQLPLGSANRVAVWRHTGAGMPGSYQTNTFYDGLGRAIQAQEEGENGQFAITTTEYSSGSSSAPSYERTWKPFMASTNDQYYTNYASAATSAYGSYGSGVKPYTTTELTRDGLRRPARIVHPYVGSTIDDISYLYKVILVDGDPYSYLETTDEDGEAARAYSDTWGNLYRSVSAYGTPGKATTETLFDALGRPTEVRPPNYFETPHGQPQDWVTTYAYDTQSRLTERTTPDAGTVRFKYDGNDNLRYSQDANREATGEVLFTTYDAFGRPRATGLYQTNFNTLNNPSTEQSWENQAANWREVNVYDAVPSTSLAPWNTFGAQIGSVQNQLGNRLGHLVATASSSGEAWQVELNSYDDEARLDLRHVFTQDGVNGPVDTDANTELRYSYNRQGQLLTRESDVGGADECYHWYDYTERGLPHRTYAGTSSNQPSTPNVTHEYHPTGSLASLRFASRPAVPYAYDLRDRLIRIGGSVTSSSPGYPFSAEYTFEPDGNVATAAFHHVLPSTEGSGTRSIGTTEATRDRFNFSYDELDRLTAADYYDYSGGWTNQPQYDLSNIAYDRSGNLLSLKRADQNGSLVDNLTYVYNLGSSRLASISDAANGASANWDAESGSFGHDANGNATNLPAPYNVVVTEYDHRNLLTMVMTGGQNVLSNYRYSASGQRYYKYASAGESAQAAPSVAGGNGRSQTQQSASDQPGLATRLRQRFTARFSGNPENEASSGSSSSPVTEYHALDALARSGTQPVVGVFEDYPIWQWNILSPSGEVMGREHFQGETFYYHKDLLGSTRAVVPESGNVSEARTYDAWGVLLEGRDTNVGSETHEGYTGKERDTEITAMGGSNPYAGLDYFGARTYAPAFARFLQVDPLMEKHPDFSPYNYVLNNPLAYIDPDGRQFLITGGPCMMCSARQRLALADETLRMASDAYDIGRSAQDIISGEPMSNWEIGGIALGASAPMISGSIGRRTGRWLGNLVDGGADAGRRVVDTWGDAGTLDRHFAEHGADFGAANADEYAARASDFLVESRGTRVPTKIDENGVIRVYDPQRNTFAAYNPDGTTRTFFRPQPRSASNPRGHAYRTNLEYWEAQRGTIVE